MRVCIPQLAQGSESFPIARTDSRRLLAPGRSLACSAGVTRGLQASQFRKRGTAGIFLAGGIAASNNFARTFAADDPKPQEVLSALMRRDLGVVGGTCNLHDPHPCTDDG